MTGSLTVKAAGTVVSTITGGAGNDTLTASTVVAKADVLNGGAGNDRLVTNDQLTQLTGGAGSDTFVIGSAGANVNIYSTITDASSGDKIQFSDIGAAGGETFARAKLSLGSTAVFQDYANLAAAGTNGATVGAISWFQFTDGNTYVVMDRSNNASFENGVDMIVKLTGLVDLSTASFNNGAAPTLQLG
jgi:S-layer protein